MKTLTVNLEGIGNRIVILGRCVNSFGFSNNRFANEFRGMTSLLNAMGVDYDINWTDDASKMTEIIIEGQQFSF